MSRPKRDPRLVLLFAAVLTALLGAVGTGGSGRLTNGGYTAAGTESARANRLLEQRFGAGNPDLVLLVRAQRGGVDSAAAREQGRRLAARLAAADGVGAVRSYWTAKDPALRSKDGAEALITADLAGEDRDAARTAKSLVPRLTGRHGALAVSATGPAWVSVEAGRISEHDLVTAELFAAPVTLLILMLALRSPLAALFPVVIGAVSVVGTLALLRLLTYAMPVSVFAMNLTSALGFGLAVDYGLFLVTRFREEMRTGSRVEEAVARTARTAGRTVAVSACTVALSMSALLVLPLPFLRSMACAGIAVALLSAAAATVLMPPLLTLAGRRLARPARLGAVARTARRAPQSVAPCRAARGRRTVWHGPAPEPLWKRAADAVTRKPLFYGAGCAVALVMLATPFAHVRFGLSDERVLPVRTAALRTSADIRAHFATPAERVLTVVLPDAHPVLDRAALDAYEGRVRRLDSVAAARILPAHDAVAPPAVGAAAPGALLTVTGPADPQSAAGRKLVARLRALPAPGGHLVTGRAALLVDTAKAVRDRLPLAAGILVLATWAMLFLLTGSVLLPVKALVVGALSLTASFGLMVHVFQDGHLRRVVGDFAVTGTLDMSMPLLMFAIAFGLAIDYEIFLLSRVKERYALTGDNRLAVVEGVARTGPLVTTAALAVAVVTGALATSGITVLKLLGTGLAVAVLVDATLVRGILVPAFMTVAGRANWWAPAPLARLHSRLHAPLRPQREDISSAIAAAKPSMSASVVSKEHIQRTSPLASSQK
jgi:RND superfamily putative drug exporter